MEWMETKRKKLSMQCKQFSFVQRCSLIWNYMDICILVLWCADFGGVQKWFSAFASTPAHFWHLFLCEVCRSTFHSIFLFCFSFFLASFSVSLSFHLCFINISLPVGLWFRLNIKRMQTSGTHSNAFVYLAYQKCRSFPFSIEWITYSIIWLKCLL